MLVSIYCLDTEQPTQTLRMDLLQSHLDWVELNMPCIKIAGPLKEGSIIIGSFYILNAASVSDAKSIFRTDPYYQSDIWKSVEFNEFSGVAGEWVGGKNWN